MKDCVTSKHLKLGFGWTKQIKNMSKWLLIKLTLLAKFGVRSLICF